MQALLAHQAGLLLIECFPYLPDLIALVRELASSHKAPSSQELLMKGAMRYAEKQGAADISVSPPSAQTEARISMGGPLVRGYIMR